MKIDLWSPDKYTQHDIDNYNKPIKKNKLVHKLSFSSKKRKKDILNKKKKRDNKLNRRSEKLKEYGIYIQSEGWFKKRREFFSFLKASGLKKQCDICASKKKLHVHHLTYKNFMREEMHDLQLLCYSCHRKAHPDKKF